MSSIAELKAQLLKGGLDPPSPAKPGAKILKAPNPTLSASCPPRDPPDSFSSGPDESAGPRHHQDRDRHERDVVRQLQHEVAQLRQELQAERVQRQKITAWIKDNLGPNLEVVLGRVSQMLQEPQQAAARSTAVTSSSSSTGGGAAGRPSLLASSSSSGSLASALLSPGNAAPSTTNRAAGVSLSESTSSVGSQPLRLQLGLDMFDDERDAGQPSSHHPPKQSPVQPPAAATGAARPALRRDDEEEFWSDQSWSDSDGDETLPSAHPAGRASKATPRKERLGALERQQSSGAGGLDAPVQGWFEQKRDATLIPTLAKVNIAPSMHLHAFGYNCPTEDLVVLLKAVDQRRGRVLVSSLCPSARRVPM
eukprot:TRINITY_DN1926_c0_g1_i2.p1 TRINITY_DN1926_c0_g1~~TRINITY_DN1926_c0_g1_i2.p1  ORF type:complete len:381 (-),score=66.99 TRINITY_DN1926_c0_g1_i2:1108-2205(-)